MQPRVSTGVVQPVSSDISRAAAPPVAAAPLQQQMPAQKKQPLSAVVSLNYDFVISELKTIGIITGIVVVILIVLYIFMR